MTPLGATFRKPFAEQVAAFRLRLGNLVPTARWDDLRGIQHDRAFMVAGALKAELLGDLAAAVDKAITEGTTLETFRKDFRAIVEKHGWHGWTGEGTARGEAWRTRVIYRTNMATSYAAGRMAQLVQGNFTFWVYRHGGSLEPRIQHLGWDGLILSPDHPFWVTHAPPNGWGCSCFVIGARTIAGAVRVGGKPGNTLPNGWQSPQPRTGTPPGIDKGWDHAPGSSVAEMVTSLVQKPVNWDYSLAVAYMRDLPDLHRDVFSRGYRELPSVATEMRLYVERVRDEQNGAAFALKVRVEPQRTLGLATNQQTREIERLTGLSLKGDLYDFAVDRDAVRHIFDRHSNAVIEASRGQRAVTPDDFARLGLLLNAPDTMGSGDTISRRGPIIRMTRRFGDETLVALFEVRTGRRRLALVTMWMETGASPTMTP